MMLPHPFGGHHPSSRHARPIATCQLPIATIGTLVGSNRPPQKPPHFKKNQALMCMPRDDVRAAPGTVGLSESELVDDDRLVRRGHATPGMIRLSEIRLPFTLAEAPEAALRAAVCELLGLAPADIARVDVFKRSFDARKALPLAVYIVDVTLAEPERATALLARWAGHPQIQPRPDMTWRPVGQAPADLPLRPVVVGFGPCGIFAALVLAQMGFKPIVLERGKPVRERARDTWDLWRKRVLHAQSNVQFGEGGAGAFSDGKLYSQIKDPRHLGRKVLHELVKAGAPPEILYLAHPHIGTFKLVRVVENLRAQIIALGGEVRFGQCVTDISVVRQGAVGRQLRGLSVLDLATGQTTGLRADHVVLAPGHSARDTFVSLYERGVAMQAKPFAIGCGSSIRRA